MIIDCQVHLWTAETPERPWPAWGHSVAHLKEPLTYPKMLSLMDEAGVDRAVIVPPSWEGDRVDYALEAAARHPHRFAVMGRIALDDPGSSKLLSSWKSQPGLLGIRLTFTYGKESWLEDGTTDWFWPAAEEADIPVMVHPQQWMSKIAEIAERHPKLRLIIDHMGLSVHIARDNKIGETIERTAGLAKFPNIFVKLSNAPSYSSESYPFRDMHPHIRRVVEAFGAQRCFWGTDLTLRYNKCSYPERVTMFTKEMSFLSEQDKEWIMGRAIQQCLGWP
jgi:predicted TIM-barrel fold metal-dependent hydrolase